MSRRISALLVGGALLMAPAAASAQASLSVAAGISAPMSDLADLTDMGYNAAVGLNFRGPMLPVGVRLEGAFDSWDFKNGGGNVRSISGSANALVNLAPGPVSPYLIGGLGMYNTRVKVDNVGASESETNAGINVGGGLRFALGGLGTFVEARYHARLGDDGGFQFVPITFGISF